MSILVSNPSVGHGSTPAVTASSPPTLGNAVIVCFAANGDQGVSSISDNYGNTWQPRVVQALDVTLGNNSASSIWWCNNITATGAGFVVTGVSVTPAEGATYGCSYIEVSGLGNAVDQIGSNQSSSTNTLTATCGGANALAGELAVAVVNTQAADATAFAVGPTWGSGGGTSIYLTTGGSQGVKTSSGYKVLSATETTSASWTWTTSGAASAVVATFKGFVAPINPGAGPAARCIYVMP